MAYDAIMEAQKLASMEEAIKQTKPQSIGSLFVKFITHDGPMTVNIHQIESYVPSAAGTFVYLIGVQEPVLVFHDYDDINSLFSLSIFR